MNHEKIINSRIRNEETMAYLDSIIQTTLAKRTGVNLPILNEVEQYILEHNQWVKDLPLEKQTEMIKEGMQYYGFGAFAKVVIPKDSVVDYPQYARQTRYDEQEKRQRGEEIYQRGRNR